MNRCQIFYRRYVFVNFMSLGTGALFVGIVSRFCIFESQKGSSEAKCNASC